MKASSILSLPLPRGLYDPLHKLNKQLMQQVRQQQQAQQHKMMYVHYYYHSLSSASPLLQETLKVVADTYHHVLETTQPHQPDVTVIPPLSPLSVTSLSSSLLSSLPSSVSSSVSSLLQSNSSSQQQASSPLLPADPALYIADLTTVFQVSQFPAFRNISLVNGIRSGLGLPAVVMEGANYNSSDYTQLFTEFSASNSEPISSFTPQTKYVELSPSFDGVVLGGTFDRLHAGHKMMLTAAALICRKHMEVGVTSEVLLGNKKFKELIEPFDFRSKTVETFLRTLNPDPNLNIVMICLAEPYANTTTSTLLKAIVVSPETEKVATLINQIRTHQSSPSPSSSFPPPVPSIALSPLSVVSIDYIAPPSSISNQAQLSSTLLRELDYKRLQQQ